MQEQLPGDKERNSLPHARAATELGRRACNALRKNGEGIARLSAATLLGSLAAISATATMPVETELANTKTTVSLNFSGNDGVDLSVGEIYYGISDWPIGITAEPAIDQVVENAVLSGEAYAQQLQADLQDKGDDILMDLLARMGGGAALGAALGMCLTEGVRGIKRHPKRLATLPTAVALAVSIQAGGYVAFQNENWDIAQPTETTGLLAKVQAAPQLFERLNNEQPIIADRVEAVNKLLLALQQEQSPNEDDVKTSLSLLHISDIHLRHDMYSYLEAYLDENEIDIIINTGDEAQFSTSQEISEAHMTTLRRITEKGVIVLFVNGNHDSPAIAAKLSSIPGVYTLDKQYAEIYGLTVAGFGDPITYTSGIDATSEVADDLQAASALETVSDVVVPDNLDMVMAHTKTAVEHYAAWALEDRDEATPLMIMSGHTHAQNSLSEIQHDGIVWLQEGSTGAGGVTRFGYEKERIEFSRLDIAENCQPTLVTRYSIKDPLQSKDEDGTPTNESIVQRKRILTSPEETNRKCGTAVNQEVRISSLEEATSGEIAQPKNYPEVDLTPER